MAEKYNQAQVQTSTRWSPVDQKKVCEHLGIEHKQNFVKAEYTKLVEFSDWMRANAIASVDEAIAKSQQVYEPQAAAQPQAQHFSGLNVEFQNPINGSLDMGALQQSLSQQNVMAAITAQYQQMAQMAAVGQQYQADVAAFICDGMIYVDGQPVVDEAGKIRTDENGNPVYPLEYLKMVMQGAEAMRRAYQFNPEQVFSIEGDQLSLKTGARGLNPQRLISQSFASATQMPTLGLKPAGIDLKKALPASKN